MEVLALRTEVTTSITRRISQLALSHLDVRPVVYDDVSDVTERSSDSGFSSIIYKELDYDLDSIFIERDSNDI